MKKLIFMRTSLRVLVGLTVLLWVAISCGRESYYVKEVTFPEGATLAEKVAITARVVPTAEQLAWQKMELTAFLHFGMNTFTGSEWGSGKEDPTWFHPTDLDCDQWAKTLSEAGFKMAILTAKHHDGFCLWPTATTEHSVKNSSWKGGQGDVVREFRDACERYGLKFGVYLSPWDRNAACYGDSPVYNELFVNQLTELLTQYGPVHEVWFDGACGEGPNGKKQVYDWDLFRSTIHRLQPQAVTAIMGDDVRWVGNERGWGRETEWSVTVPGLEPTSADLGSRDVLAEATSVRWYPSEVDVSIRPGWFYHAYEDEQVRSLDNLMDIYFQSVGRNSVLLLNIPPDTRGHFADPDVARLLEFGDAVRALYEYDAVVDGDVIWTAQAGESREFVVVPSRSVNVVMLQEDIARGQRIEEFSVEVLVTGEAAGVGQVAGVSEGAAVAGVAEAGAGTWVEVARGTTVGYKRMLRFPTQSVERIRVNILASRDEAHVAKVALFSLPE